MVAGHGSYTGKTNGCGELSLRDEGKKVELYGWVDNKRDHGGLLFVDLKDRSGKVQIVSDPRDETFKVLEKVKPHWVIKVKGTVGKRPADTENPDMKTGQIEILTKNVEVIKKSKTPPFEIDDEVSVDEKLRLKYRYLDIRRPSMTENLILRHKIALETRNFLSGAGFLEIETPYLTKSTPEGARDFLVPSRLNPGKFYALPQSPQLFKQILMVSGIEKYFQLARCFRDEDFRRDRQPEHTQIDIEISFAEQENIMTLIEDLFVRLFKLNGIELKKPFKRLTYERAMLNYGTDRPDLRFEMKIKDLTGLFKNTEISIFKIGKKGIIAGIVLPEIFTRKELDELTEQAKELGAGGLAWFLKEKNDIKSPLKKFASKKELNDLKELMGEKGTVLIVAGEKYLSLEVLGTLRKQLGEKLDLINKSEFYPVWITDFPLFEWSKEDERWKSMHHPFTRPTEKTIKYLESNPEKVKASAYDVVINGIEIGGGSLRIFDREVQNKVFEILGFKKEEINKKFGFLIEAFKYGVPPHGGIAIGLDRLVMIILGRDTIRDVIAFPKTQAGTCLLTGAPDEVEEKQLRELGIKTDRK